jgi:hypothetical protein
MDGRKKYLKGLAFVPAIVLVGGFIGCQAGLINLGLKTEPQPEIQPDATAQPQSNADGQQTFMPGSKSINLSGATLGLTPSSEPAQPANAPWLQPGIPQPPPKPEQPPVFMPGSKSFRPVPYVPSTTSGPVPPSAPNAHGPLPPPP